MSAHKKTLYLLFTLVKRIEWPVKEMDQCGTVKQIEQMKEEDQQVTKGQDGYPTRSLKVFFWFIIFMRTTWVNTYLYVAMFSYIHLGKWAYISHSNYINSKIAQEINNLQGFGSDPEAEDNWCNNWTNQFF